MNIGKYLKYKLKTIAAFILFAAVIIICFRLYRLPMKAIAYPLILCAVLGLIILSVGYFHEKEKTDQLNYTAGFSPEYLDDMPKPDSAMEEEYRKMIRSMCDEHIDYRQETEARYIDMLDYYGSWVHQIKTPIASMKLTLQNEDSSLSRRLQMDLMRIEKYVDMVMTYLRLNSNDTDYVIKEHDLDEIIRSEIREYAGEFINRQITLDYTGLGFRVITDDKWLGFVIGQLLSNALKYTPSGSIRIYMEGNDLCIADTGIGIDPADLPRIFEKGFTGFNGRQDKKASGIGLFLCKRICSGLGHSISAESEPGCGTTIRLGLGTRETLIGSLHICKN